MERLTDKNADGNYFYPKCFEKCDGLGASSKCDNCEIMTSVCDNLGEYEDLDEQGRLVKLPCKEVYFIVDINFISNKCAASGFYKCYIVFSLSNIIIIIVRIITRIRV